MKLFLLFHIPIFQYFSTKRKFFFSQEVQEIYITLIQNGRTNIPGLKKVDK